MHIGTCDPHGQSIRLDSVDYEDAMILKTMLENEKIGPNRWAELIATLQLIIIANQPEETISATKSRTYVPQY